MEGKCDVVYSDGSKFEGSFHHGRRDGRGTYTFADGQTYTCRWNADAAEGSGTLLMPRQVRVSDDEIMIPLNIQTDLGKIHLRAGFDKLGQ
jgi:hypothetical protein